MAVNLRPFRDYDEKDVINLYTLDVSSLDSSHNMTTWDLRVPAGTLVAMNADGWKTDDELQMIGGAGDLSVDNVTSQRYGVEAKVAVSGAAARPLGMMLHHFAKYDENGELLKYNPRKASELEAAIEGQAVPVVTRGIFLISGLAGTGSTALTAAGQDLYAGANGQISSHDAGSSVRIGQALGLVAGGNVLIKLEL